MKWEQSDKSDFSDLSDWSDWSDEADISDEVDGQTGRRADGQTGGRADGWTDERSRRLGRLGRGRRLGYNRLKEFTEHAIITRYHEYT